jgi:hypothetical protein
MASTTFLSKNNAAHSNKFNVTVILLKSKLNFEEQKLRFLIKSDGVCYEVVVVQDQNKTYTFIYNN